MAVSGVILATGLLCIPKVHKMGTGKIRDGKEYQFHVNFQKTIIETLLKLKKKKMGTEAGVGGPGGFPYFVCPVRPACNTP